jgi:hypothetical protein
MLIQVQATVTQEMAEMSEHEDARFLLKKEALGLPWDFPWEK